MSSGLPRGAPLSTQAPIVAISASVSDMSSLMAWMPTSFSRNHGGITPIRFAQRRAVLDAPRPRPHPLHRSSATSGASELGRWQLWQLSCRIGAMSFAKVTGSSPGACPADRGAGASSSASTGMTPSSPVAGAGHDAILPWNMRRIPDGSAASGQSPGASPRLRMPTAAIQLPTTRNPICIHGARRRRAHPHARRSPAGSRPGPGRARSGRPTTGCPAPRRWPVPRSRPARRRARGPAVAGNTGAAATKAPSTTMAPMFAYCRPGGAGITSPRTAPSPIARGTARDQANGGIAALLAGEQAEGNQGQGEVDGGQRVQHAGIEIPDPGHRMRRRRRRCAEHEQRNERDGRGAGGPCDHSSRPPRR